MHRPSAPGLAGDPAWPTYRAASRFILLWLVIVLGGIAGSIGLLFAIYGPNRQGSPWLIFGLIAGGVVASIALGLVITHSLERRRWSAAAAQLAAEGWTMAWDLEDAARSAAFAPVAHLEAWLGLQTGAGGIRWAATRQGGAAVMFEHEYTTGSGKSTQTHTHTVLAWRAPPWWPMIRFTRVGRFEHWQLKRIAGQDISLGDEAFDKAWRIDGDAPFARRLGTPSFREALRRAPVGEGWVLGGGWAVMCCRAPLDGPNTLQFVRRCLRVMGELPADLWSDNPT
ncbi:MAG: hypothetical protein JNJ48_04455 [Phycisphaerae bacterium]|nr:hypothetical protein [Phycisphaerae bacterium]